MLNLLGFVTYIDSLAGTVDIRNSSQTPNATRLDSMTFMDLTKGYIGYNTLIGEVAGILTRAVLSRESEEISALFWLDYTKVCRLQTIRTRLSR